jgi:hypothetical protein
MLRLGREKISKIRMDDRGEFANAREFKASGGVEDKNA